MSASEQTGKHSVRRPERLINDAIAAYCAWSAECTSVRDAYSHWTNARRADAPLAFARYRSALDREERAADRYHTVAARLGEDMSELTSILRERFAS